MTILYFIISLGVLVFIHEFGHFIVAKKQGIGVEKFSIGFGPKLLAWRRGETEYLISALPFGGYVKLQGEDPAEADPSDKKNYSARPIWQRVPVVFAGPFMNLVLAFLLMPLVFVVGRMEPKFLDEKPVVIGVSSDSPASQLGLQKGDEIIRVGDVTFQSWKDYLDYVLIHGGQVTTLEYKRDGQSVVREVTIQKSAETHTGFLGVEPAEFIGNDPILDEVSPDGPAAQGGLMAGDLVLSVDGKPIQTWTGMSEHVGKSEGKALVLVVRRAGSDVSVKVTPRFDEGLKKWIMGVKKNTEASADFFVKKQYPLGEAFVLGMKENWRLGEMTLSVLKRLVTFQLSYKTLGGPIRIAQASAMAARSGLSDFIYFLCFLSIQLGVLNLLPLPVLDGGHLLFFALEGTFRRPVSVRVRQAFEQVGFVLLVSLMLMVTFNDIQSLWNISALFEKLKHLF